MGKNKQKKSFDPERNVSETTLKARKAGYTSPKDAYTKDVAFDPSKEVPGWHLMLPFNEVRPTDRLRIIDALKHVNVPVGVEVVRASHILQTNFTAQADLIDVCQKYFVADAAGFNAFLNADDKVDADEALGRTSGLCVSYAVLLKKHFSS
jgi:hypothetical protein